MPQRNKTIWFFIFAAYFIFIFIFSYLYPYGLDEYFCAGFGIKDSFLRASYMFWFHVPRVAGFVVAFILYFGKWLFLILNPLMQLACVFGVFYLVYMRPPDLKTLKDLPVFVLILFLMTFAIPVPANILFWIGGAVNYAWNFLVFIFFLCALRAFMEGRPLFKDSALSAAGLFILGLCLGAGNENNSPMAFIIFLCFFAACRYTKKKLPRWYFFAFAGLTAGLCFMFLTPALSTRLEETAPGFELDSLLERLFMHLYHLHVFLKATLLVPVAAFLGFIICAVDKDHKPFKSKDFILGLACLCVAFILFFVLFVAPDAGARNYYSAAVLCIAGLVFLFNYVQQTYKLNFIKYAALAMMVYGAVVLPFFAIPVVNLHWQSVYRKGLIESAVKNNHKIAAIPLYLSVSPGIANYEVLFYDVMYTTALERAQYFPIYTIPLRIHRFQLPIAVESAIF